MNKTNTMLRTVGAMVAFLVAMQTMGQEAPADGLTALVKALPEVNNGRYVGPDRADAEKLWDEIWKGGAESVSALVDMVDAAGPGKDFQPSYALHGLVTHLGQPGRDKDRRLLVDALAATLAGEKKATTKAIVLRELLHARGREAIPAIGKLLLDAELCEYASQALFSFGGDAAAAELRRVAKVAGKTRMTVLRGLGELRDHKAIPLLRQALADSDRDMRVVAADALAEIGDPSIAGALFQAVSASSILEKGMMRGACLRLARRLVEENRQNDAEALLLKLWDSASDPVDVPLRCAVISGLAKVGTKKAVALIAESCRAQDARLSLTAVRAAAGMTVREMIWFNTFADDEKVRAIFVREVAFLGFAAAPNVIFAGMMDASKGVRLAAIDAVSGSADGRTVAMLMAFVADADGGIRDAAMKALRRIQPGEAVEKVMASSLAGADTAVACRLLEVLAARMATGQRAAVAGALEHKDAAVRAAATKALGTLGSDEDAGRLIEMLRKTPDGGERAMLSDAIGKLARRSPARGEIVAELSSLAGDASAALRADVVRTLGRIGGSSCLGPVRKALEDADAGVKDAAVRALSEWQTTEVLPQLLELARTTDDTKHHVLALRGAVSLVEKSRGERSDKENVAQYKSAMEMARRPDEKKMVIGAVAKVYHGDALVLAEVALDGKEFPNEAESACLSLADRLGRNRESKDKALGVLKRIADTSKNEKHVKRALELLGKYEGKK